MSRMEGLADVGSALVTVVIPCFNAQEFIEATLNSVLAQTYPHFEVIVVDDKSTDQSRNVVARVMARDARVKLIEMQQNAGAPAKPRNIGIRAAQGEWIALLDADDIWHPRKLEVQMRLLARHRAAMCSTEMRDFGSESEIAFLPVDAPTVKRVTFRQQLLKYRTPTSSIVIRRELMLAHPFNEDLSFKAREDTDCFIRVHESIPCSLKVCHPFVYYRLQSAQISGNKWRMVARHFSMLKKYRLRSGRPLGVMAYVYTATHFAASIYLRLILRRL